MNGTRTAETRAIPERSGAFSGRIEAAPSRVLEALKPGPDHPLSRRRATVNGTRYIAPLAERPTYVYRAFNHDGTLLYVGISQDYKRRINRGHYKTAAWYDEADTWVIAAYGDRDSAQAAEAWAISHEGPWHNYTREQRYLPSDLPEPVETFPFRPSNRVQNKRFTPKIAWMVAEHGWDYVKEHTHPQSWYEVV